MANQNQIEKTKPLEIILTPEKLTLDLIKSNPKIRELTEFKPLREVIGKCFIKAGLSFENYPTENERMVLENFIIGCYGGYMLEEISLAFDLAITGKLGAVDTNCYQNFSCQYLGRIMHAYHIWRMKQIAKSQKSADEIPDQMTDEQWFEKMLIEPYDVLVQTGNYPWSEFQDRVIFTKLREIGFKLEVEKDIMVKLSSKAVSMVKAPTGLSTPEKKKEYKESLERYVNGLVFNYLIREKAKNKVDMRKHIMIQLSKIKNGKQN